MTLEAWVRPAKPRGWRTLLLKEARGKLAYGLYARTKTNRPAGYAGATRVDGRAKLPIGAWRHVAVTYDGAALRLYVNGTLAATKRRTGRLTASKGPLRIGGSSIGKRWFAGRIDDVRVYARALTGAEIKRDRNTAVT